MKKVALVSSIATALGVVVAAASAQTLPLADRLEFNPAGIGHMLIVPYFSTQGSNVTALSIVNADLVNGKAVKVRFRGASNADDVFNFQVLLSPGDVWTAAIWKNAAGLSELGTVDKSCTLPANVNLPFKVERTAPQATEPNAETREGYIELITMGDIIDGGGSQSALYTAVRHTNGVAPCTASVLNALTKENAAQYLAPPTTGLSANWMLINVDRIVAYSEQAEAIEARAPAPAPVPIGAPYSVPGRGQLVYWDQRATNLTQAEAEANTADPLFRGTSPATQATRRDLPDLSTPYTTLPFAVTSRPFVQARRLSDSFATVMAQAEFFNLSSVGAATDWVISMPTRRYFASVKYLPTPTIVRTAEGDGNIYFTAFNTEPGNAVNGGRNFQSCLILGVAFFGVFDRDERPPQDRPLCSSPFICARPALCGGVTVWGINSGPPEVSATFSTSARNQFPISSEFTEGWAWIDTGAAAPDSGLPILGRQFTRVSNTTTNVNYGLSYRMKVMERGTPPAYVPPAR